MADSTVDSTRRGMVFIPSERLRQLVIAVAPIAEALWSWS
jgi:hypothetical protein